MTASADGGYVRYEDYKTLAAEVRRLTDERIVLRLRIAEVQEIVAENCERASSIEGRVAALSQKVGELEAIRDDRDRLTAELAAAQAKIERVKGIPNETLDQRSPWIWSRTKGYNAGLGAARKAVE